MNINAKYFGSVSYTEKDTINLKNGLYGFESYTKYLPLSFHEEDDSMLSLQCLEDEELSFILMNPFNLSSDYDPILTDSDLKELGADSINDISFYVICVVSDPLSDSTVNLRAPIAVNAETRAARQVLLEQPEYHFRHTLASFQK